MIVRLATPADAEALSQLYTQLGYHTRAEDLYNRPIDQTFVSIQDSQITGVIELHIKQNHYRPEPSCSITALAVDEKHRRQGIGKQLIDFAIQYAKERGCAFIELATNRRRAEAHQFYEAVGFTDKTHQYFCRDV